MSKFGDVVQHQVESNTYDWLCMTIIPDSHPMLMSLRLDATLGVDKSFYGIGKPWRWLIGRVYAWDVIDE